MNDTEVPPPQKKMKIVNQGKCVKCSDFLRKYPAAKCKKMNSREEASNFFKLYDYFIQENDTLCEKCFSSLRLLKYKLTKSSTKATDPSHMQSVPALHQNTNEESIAKMDNINGSGMQLLIDFPVIDICQEPSSSQQTILLSQNSQQSISSCTTSKEHSSISEYQPSDTSKDFSTKIRIPFKRTIATHRYCFICSSKTNLRDVPIEARLQLFTSSRRIFIPERNKCCTDHLIGTLFYEEEVENIRWYARESLIDTTELEKFLNKMSEDVNISLLKKIGNRAISEERVRILTGMSWDHLCSIEKLMVNMRNSENRSIKEALVIFLLKLRSGNSNRLVSATMNVSENMVSDSINSILNCFEQHVLPIHFGVEAHSREFYLTQTSSMADQLFNFGDSLAVICDGTYLRHEKSSNNSYQRKSYSGQKRTSLAKPFTMCITNGFLVDIAGPFTGNKNDAEILLQIMKSSEGISKILKPGDIFILDRGFRDAKKFLEEQGYRILMPALKGKRKQLTTKESNDSRFVTKVRWVVESAHGIMANKYRLLHNQMRNRTLPRARVYCRTAGFLYNATCKRLDSDKNQQQEIVQRMYSTQKTINLLAQIVADGNYDRKKKPFQQISSEDLLDFPRLSVDQLKLLFTGSYQLSQAVSYLGEMINDDNSLTLSFMKADASIVRFEVRSRHINSKTYKPYIQYDAASSGLNGIEGYCCNCANGLRTVGCCSHVASVIYYLSNARYLAKIIRTGDILTDLFDLDTICPVISDRDDAWDSDDEGDQASDEDVDMGEDEDIDEDEELDEEEESDDDHI